MSHPAEVRTLPLGRSELRLIRDSTGRPTIQGLAVPYGPLSVELLGPQGRSFRERFARGAFTRALKGDSDVRALVNHDPSLILGRSGAGTLRLMDGPDGLRYEIDPPDTPLAQHYLTAIERGDMSGSSFRFYTTRDDWSVEDDVSIRTVEEADIDDVSIVTYPAYPDTTAALRSLDEHRRIMDSLRQTPRRNRAARLIRLAEID